MTERQRYDVERGSSTYFVIDNTTHRAVASYPFGHERERGLAYSRAWFDVHARNEKEKKKGETAL